MTERRFFVNGKIEQTVCLCDDEFNHLKNVLRLKQNDKVILVCGDGWDYHATIVEIGKKSATLHVTNKTKNNNDPKLKITLFLGLVRNDSFSSIVTRMSELGVSKIVPFDCDNTDTKPADVKIEKMQKVANMAIKQCDMSIPTKIEPVCKFEEMLAKLKEYEDVFFAYESEKNNKEKFVANKNNIAVIIGPIGGFSSREVELLKNIPNCNVVSLGRRIMRVETACASLVSVLMYTSGEWES